MSTPAGSIFYLPTVPNFAGGSVYNWYQDMDIIFAQSQEGRKRSDSDKRKIIDEVESNFNKKARNNKLVLMKIESSVNYIKSGVANKTLLLYEGYEFSIYHRKQIETITKREIQICYDYGLILIDALNENYKIVKL